MLEVDEAVPWPAVDERRVIVDPLPSVKTAEESDAVAAGTASPRVTLVAVDCDVLLSESLSADEVVFVCCADHSDRLLASAARADD